jgi:hypothetical protein
MNPDTTQLTLDRIVDIEVRDEVFFPFCPKWKARSVPVLDLLWDEEHGRDHPNILKVGFGDRTHLINLFASGIIVRDSKTQDILFDSTTIKFVLTPEIDG